MMFDIKQLKRTRLRLGLTQTQFAKAAGLSQSLVTKIEAGKIDPKYSTVQRIEQTMSIMENKTQPAVADIVQRNIISATLSERIPHLIKRMQHAGISQAPVMDGKHVAGLVTESLILEAISTGKNLSQLSAEDIMIESPPILPIATPLSVATKVLEHAPLIIITEKNHVAGIVTRSDLIKATL